MPDKKHPIIVRKVFATLLGCIVVLADTWFTATSLLRASGDPSLMTAMIIANIGAAASVVFADYALHDGQWLKAMAFIAFFGLTSLYSFSVSVERVGKLRADEMSAREGGNEDHAIRKQVYEIAASAKEAECNKERGRRCREAERAFSDAASKLESAPKTVVTDIMGRSLTALTGLSAETIHIWQPMLIAGAFQVGGVVLIAYGFSPRRREDPIDERKLKFVQLEGATPAEQAAFDRLVQILLSRQDMTIEAADRELARMVKATPQSFHLWMRKWKTAGHVQAAGRGQSQRVSLTKQG